MLGAIEDVAHTQCLEDAFGSRDQIASLDILVMARSFWGLFSNFVMFDATVWFYFTLVQGNGGLYMVLGGLPRRSSSTPRQEGARNLREPTSAIHRPTLWPIQVGSPCFIPICNRGCCVKTYEVYYFKLPREVIVELNVDGLSSDGVCHIVRFFFFFFALTERGRYK